MLATCIAGHLEKFLHYWPLDAGYILRFTHQETVLELSVLRIYSPGGSDIFYRPGIHLKRNAWSHKEHERKQTGRRMRNRNRSFRALRKEREDGGPQSLQLGVLPDDLVHVFGVLGHGHVAQQSHPGRRDQQSLPRALWIRLRQPDLPDLLGQCKENNSC